MNEQFLQYIWKYQLLNTQNLFTKSGKKLEIINQGKSIIPVVRTLQELKLELKIPFGMDPSKSIFGSRIGIVMDINRI